MEVKPCREYGPEAMVEEILFHSVRAGGTGGNVTMLPVDAGSDAAVVVARLCAAVGVEVVSWDRCAAVFVPDKVLLCVTAAVCLGPADSLVVCGGSLKLVSWPMIIADELA